MRNVPDHHFDQSAVIPYRVRDGVLEILLISSRKKKRWVIPKGIRELGLSAQQSAEHEALEKAGVDGAVLPEPVGRYEYRKWRGTCHVHVFLMAVNTVRDEWPDSHRDREWLSVDEASQRVAQVELKRIISSVPDWLRRGVVFTASAVPAIGRTPIVANSVG